MKKYIVYLFATLFFFSAQSNAQLLIKSVLDGALTHGTPKAIQFYAPFDIPDLSAYSVESSNCIDPLQTDCTPVDVEYTFPAVSVQAGTCFWLSVLDNNFIAPDTLREILGGEDPLFTSNVALFNGDDALMVQYLGMPHDVYGIPGTDGTGANWEYTDGYVVRKDSVYAPQSSFINSEWNIYPYFWGTDIQQYITAGREYNFACTLPKVASLAVENCNCQFLVTSYTFDAGTYDLVLTSNNSPIYNFEIKFYNNSDWQNFKAALTAMQQPSRTVDLADGGGSYVSFYFSNNVTLINSDSLSNIVKYSVDLSVDVPPDNILSCIDVYDYAASNNTLESAWAALPDGSAIGNGWFKLDVLLPQENCIYLALDCPNLQSLIYHQNLYELPLQAAALLAAVQQDYPGVQGWNNAYCDFWTLPNDTSDYIPVSFPDTIPLGYESCTTAEQLYYLYSKHGNNNGTVNNGHPDTLVYGNSFTYLGVLDNTAVHPIQGYGIAGWYVYAVCASSVPPNDSNGHDWVLASDYPLQPVGVPSAYTEPLCNTVSTCVVDSTLSCPANTTLVFAGTHFNLPSDAAVLLDSIQAYYPNVVAWTDGDFCSVVTSGDEDYIPVSLPLNVSWNETNAEWVNGSVGSFSISDNSSGITLQDGAGNPLTNCTVGVADVQFEVYRDGTLDGTASYEYGAFMLNTVSTTLNWGQYLPHFGFFVVENGSIFEFDKAQWAQAQGAFGKTAGDAAELEFAIKAKDCYGNWSAVSTIIVEKQQILGGDNTVMDLGGGTYQEMPMGGMYDFSNDVNLTSGQGFICGFSNYTAPAISPNTTETDWAVFEYTKGGITNTTHRPIYSAVAPAAELAPELKDLDGYVWNFGTSSIPNLLWVDCVDRVANYYYSQPIPESATDLLTHFAVGNEVYSNSLAVRYHINPITWF